MRRGTIDMRSAPEWDSMTREEKDKWIEDNKQPCVICDKPTLTFKYPQGVSPSDVSQRRYHCHSDICLKQERDEIVWEYTKGIPYLGWIKDKDARKLVKDLFIEVNQLRDMVEKAVGYGAYDEEYWGEE